MQVAPPQQKWGRAAFGYGSLFGLGLAVLQIGFAFIPKGNTGGWSLIVSFLLWLAGLMTAGAVVAKKKGSVGAGTIAGLWGGVIGGFIIVLALMIAVIVALNMPGFREQLDRSALNSGMSAQSFTGATIAVVIIFLIILWAIGIGLGAGYGALGGLIGKRMSPVRNVPPPVYPQYPQYPQPPQYTQYPPNQYQYPGTSTAPQEQQLREYPPPPPPPPAQ